MHLSREGRGLTSGIVDICCKFWLRDGEIEWPLHFCSRISGERAAGMECIVLFEKENSAWKNLQWILKDNVVPLWKVWTQESLRPEASSKATLAPVEGWWKLYVDKCFSWVRGFENIVVQMPGGFPVKSAKQACIPPWAKRVYKWSTEMERHWLENFRGWGWVA